MFFWILRGNNNRRCGVLLLLAFAASVFLGPLAHAKVGIEFNAPGHEQMNADDLLPGASDHGHNHDGDVPGNNFQQHTHDHNAADHSHEVPGVAAFPVETPGSFSDARYLAAIELLRGNATFDIDRPPRR